MKYTIITILLIISGSVLFFYEINIPDKEKQKVYSKSYYDNGNLQKEGYYLNEKKDGYWRFYHENGQLGGVGYFNKGKETGHWEFYKDNGQLAFTKKYKNNKEKNYIFVK